VGRAYSAHLKFEATKDRLEPNFFRKVSARLSSSSVTGQQAAQLHDRYMMMMKDGLERFLKKIYSTQTAGNLLPFPPVYRK